MKLNISIDKNITFEISNLSIQQLIDLLKSIIDPNACLGNCSNNGLCEYSLTKQKFNCVCDLYFTGAECEYDIRPCSKSPCLNNGECIQNLTNLTDISFYCNCSQFYGGVYCENKVDLCQNETCFSNGNCVELNNSPKCKCFNLYEGDRCEIISSSLKTRTKVKTVTVTIAIVSIVVFYMIIIAGDLVDKFVIKGKKSIANNSKFRSRMRRKKFRLKFMQ